VDCMDRSGLRIISLTTGQHFLQHDSFLHGLHANDGRPDDGSTSSLVLPYKNTAVHHLTMHYDSTSSPYKQQSFSCVTPAAERSL